MNFGEKGHQPSKFAGAAFDLKFLADSWSDSNIRIPSQQALCEC